MLLACARRPRRRPHLHVRELGDQRDEEHREEDEQAPGRALHVRPVPRPRRCREQPTSPIALLARRRPPGDRQAPGLVVALPGGVIAGHQQQGQQREVGHDGAAPVADERQGDAGQRDQLGDAADDDERLQSEDGGQARGEQTREVVPRPHGDAQAAVDEDEVEQDDARGARQPQLLADGREDEVGRQGRDDGVAVVEHQVALAQAAAEQPAGGEREQRLGDLVPLAGHVLPWIEPDVHPDAHVGEDPVEHGGPAREQHRARDDVERPARGDVHQGQQRGEEEQAGAQVLEEDHQQQREAPEGEERRQVLERRDGHPQDAPGADRQEFAHLGQVGGEEDHQQQLGELRRLEADAADPYPQARPVDLAPQDHREHQEGDAGQPDEVLVLGQRGEAAAEREHDDEHRQGRPATTRPAGGPGRRRCGRSGGCPATTAGR